MGLFPDNFVVPTWDDTGQRLSHPDLPRVHPDYDDQDPGVKLLGRDPKGRSQGILVIPSFFLGHSQNFLTYEPDDGINPYINTYFKLKRTIVCIIESSILSTLYIF